MFKQRLITGLLLFVFVLLSIFLLPMTLFLFLTCLVFLLAAWEWSLLLKLHSWFRFFYVLVIGVAMLFIPHVSVRIVLWAAAIWWLLALFWIVIYPQGVRVWNQGIWVRACMGFFTLLPSWLAINMIRSAENGVAILLFLLFLVCATDVGAYLFGRWLGKHLLAPHVSPKKTQEGLVGGIIFALFIVFLWLLVRQIPLHHWWTIFFVSFITILFSVVGDLLESMLKREAGIKDTGHYLPGHGGILDRIDSLMAAAPIFLLLCLLLKGNGL